MIPLLLLLMAAPAQAQRPSAPWDSVQVAWDAGDFPQALRRIQRLLQGPDAERWLEPAALLTGELFVTRELAGDGRAPRWSPGGRYAAWEVGLGSQRRTVIARITAEGTAERVAELAGSGLAFAPGDGFAAYVTPGGGVRDLALATLAERDIPTPGLRVRGLVYATDGTLLARSAGAADTTTTVVALGPVAPEPRPPVDSAMAWVARDSGLSALMVRADSGGAVRVLLRTARPLANPVLSPGRDLVAFQQMPREDWELFVVPVAGGAPRRLTREIQHDVLPQFLGGGLLLDILGEGRHRRSYVVDVASGARRRLFHNNTVRTISSEYAWAVSPEGRRIIISADRDGNTVSPERGLYLTDLGRRVTVDEVRRRVESALAAELALRERAQRLYQPVMARTREAVRDVSTSRIDRYAHDLFAFDSKFIGQPGNRAAIDYLAGRLREFGYQPEIQWFEPRPGIRSANVIATLRGTVDADVTYVAGSHFDSVLDSPGGDDDSSGSSALLETARVLAQRPQRATIRFVWYTAEEAGLLGSRYFAQRALADSVRVVGGLNNDMVGWMNDHRLDNTIRYSNDGLRDLQHGAALLFSDMTTYDSRYYQNTDAHSLFDAFGDVIGGIGSYPVLGNPHYHQPHDVLETIDQQLVAEVAKVTTASLILMASSPSRLRGVAAGWEEGAAVVSWQPAVESGVRHYRVSYGPPDRPGARTLTTRATRATLRGAQPGWEVEVRAAFGNGLESWDGARATIGSRE